MKTVIGILLLLAVVLAGCAEVTATGDMRDAIISNSNAAAVKLSGIDEKTADELKEALTTNAAILTEYSDAVTLNWFAYAFGDKTMFVSAKFYLLAQKEAAAARDVLKKANAIAEPSETDINDWRDWVCEEWQWLVHWENSLKGKE